jgi:hypothetical protein
MFRAELPFNEFWSSIGPPASEVKYSLVSLTWNCDMKDCIPSASLFSRTEFSVAADVWPYGHAVAATKPKEAAKTSKERAIGKPNYVDKE